MSNRRNENSVLFSLKQLKEIEITNEAGTAPAKAAATKRQKGRKFKASKTDDTQSILAGLLDDTSREAEQEKQLIESKLHAKEQEAERKKREDLSRRKEDARQKREAEDARRLEISQRRESRKREKELQEKIARGEITPDQFSRAQTGTTPGFQIGVIAQASAKKPISRTVLAIAAAVLVLIGSGVGGWLYATSEKPGQQLNDVAYKSALDNGANVLVARVLAYNNSANVLVKYAQANLNTVAMAIMKKNQDELRNRNSLLTNANKKSKKGRKRYRKRGKRLSKRGPKTTTIKIKNVFTSKKIVK